MTDEKLITDFLEENYRVQMHNHNNVFSVCDLKTDNVIFLNDFYELIDKIFGYFIGSYVIPRQWTNKYIKKITSELNDYFKTLDLTLGSKELASIFCNHFEEYNSINQNFLVHYFNRYYFDNILQRKIMVILNQSEVVLGDRDWKVIWIGHGTIDIHILKKKFGNENDEQQKNLYELYEKWYDDKINKLSENILNIFP